MQEHISIDWMFLLRNVPRASNNLQASWNDLYHLVILPFYNEPYEVMRGSLESIAKSNYPKEKMFVALAREERAGESAKITAEKLEREFGKIFFKFLVTAHPANIPGEFPGKGSNESFAGQEAKTRLIDALHIPYERVIVSSLDSDTKVYPDYFACVSYHYLTVPDPLRASYQPIPVYNNNIWSSPALSRVVATSGTFWQMMQQARPERLTTFSSHSMPFYAIVEMDFWNKKNVSEDSRIFWKALLFYDGAYRAVPLYYSVSLDANVAPTLLQTAQNVYLQQRRWGWGVENIPYAFFGFWKNKKIRFGTKLYYAFNQLEGFWSWATNSLMIFLLGWMPVLLGGAAFNTSVLSYNLPRITRWLMTAAMFGLITSAIYSTRLLPLRPAGHPFRKYVWMV
ncbi:glycosyltransferase family 2 protein, partial [Patescibacteria group bacterium]|nr:glycosyltransferase family 2 protein [Patescibacteria group bacterium]